MNNKLNSLQHKNVVYFIEGYTRSLNENRLPSSLLPVEAGFSYGVEEARPVLDVIREEVTSGQSFALEGLRASLDDVHNTHMRWLLTQEVDLKKDSLIPALVYGEFAPESHKLFRARVYGFSEALGIYVPSFMDVSSQIARSFLNWEERIKSRN